PFRAERSRTSKLPNPIICTFSPSLSESMTDSNRASTAFAASFLDRSLFSATALIKSVLFMIFTSSQKNIICYQQIIKLFPFVHQIACFYTSSGNKTDDKAYTKEVLHKNQQ